MIECQFIALCNKAIVDRHSGELTVVDVLTSVDMQVLPAPLPPIKLVAILRRTDSTDFRKLVLVGTHINRVSKSEVIQSKSFEFSFGTLDRVIKIMEVSGFPLNGEGELTFHLQSDHDIVDILKVDINLAS